MTLPAMPAPATEANLSVNIRQHAKHFVCAFLAKRCIADRFSNPVLHFRIQLRTLVGLAVVLVCASGLEGGGDSLALHINIQTLAM
jgi:hypothetical protein